MDLFPEAHKQTGPCAAQGGLASQAAGMPAQAQAQYAPHLCLPCHAGLPCLSGFLCSCWPMGACATTLAEPFYRSRLALLACSDLAEPVICGIKDDFARTSDVAQTTRLFSLGPPYRMGRVYKWKWSMYVRNHFKMINKTARRLHRPQ